MEIIEQQFSLQFDKVCEQTQTLGLNTQLLKTQKSNIRRCFTCSPFIARVATQYPKAFIEFLTIVSQQAFCLHQYHKQAQLSFEQKLAACSIDNQAMQIIREYRNLQMLSIAWLDILQLQSIEDSLLACSDLADHIIQQTYSYAYSSLCDRYGSPEDKQQLLILGMGKLGGRELNFSSDIDLIFVYPKKGYTQGERKPIEHQVFFTRLAQKLINLLDTRTEAGQAYRVDMRLRPLGESGPLVVSFGAFENYYQEQGRQWERFAMQKMRIINDTRWNSKLLAIVKPFVYRKYVDYTTIDAIREMKELIEKELRRRKIQDNIKLGKGGIREAEFFVQSLQLVHAGRVHEIQHASILEAITALNKANLLQESEATQLTEAYLDLRKTEQFLQQIDDKQTQTLPNNLEEQWRLRSMFNFTSCEAYKEKCQSAMACIHTLFSGTFGDANKSRVPQNERFSVFEDVWKLALTKSEFSTLLSSHHLFIDAKSPDLDSFFNDLYQSICALKLKQRRMALSAKTHSKIDRLLPILLNELITLDNVLPSSEQIEAVFNILNTICGRVTYLDLLVEHPEVRNRLLSLCRRSIWISQQIAQYPLLLDELLHPQYLLDDEHSLSEWQNEYTANLRQSLLRVERDDVERVMEVLREFKLTNQLRIAASELSNTLPINKVSDKLSILAEVIIKEVIEFAWYQISQIFGEPTGNEYCDKNIVLIGYGKLGGYELSYGSDLDVIFLHGADLNKMTTPTGSRKQLTNQEFYIKLVQRIIHVCTTKTYSGQLYEIDLRLRPAGNSGLLVSHINTFADYQNNIAWTWEHQALVRSRAILGDAHLIDQFAIARTNALKKARETASLRTEIYEMREKMRKHLHKTHKNAVDLKHAPGGIVDLEFLVQFWVLLNAHKLDLPQRDNIIKWSDNLRILASLATANLISKEQADFLTESYLYLRHLTHTMQLSGLSYAPIDEELSERLQKVSDIYQQYLYAQT